jgi:hypothetical protein
MSGKRQVIQNLPRYRATAPSYRFPGHGVGAVAAEIESAGRQNVAAHPRNGLAREVSHQFPELRLN